MITLSYWLRIITYTNQWTVYDEFQRVISNSKTRDKYETKQNKNIFTSDSKFFSFLEEHASIKKNINKLYNIQLTNWILWNGKFYYRDVIKWPLPEPKACMQRINQCMIDLYIDLLNTHELKMDMIWICFISWREDSQFGYAVFIVKIFYIRWLILDQSQHRDFFMRDIIRNVIYDSLYGIIYLGMSDILVIHALFWHYIQ